jgi:hypothetical protein
MAPAKTPKYFVNRIDHDRWTRIKMDWWMIEFMDQWANGRRLTGHGPVEPDASWVIIGLIVDRHG